MKNWYHSIAIRLVLNFFSLYIFIYFFFFDSWILITTIHMYASTRNIFSCFLVEILTSFLMLLTTVCVYVFLHSFYYYDFLCFEVAAAAGINTQQQQQNHHITLSKSVVMCRLWNCIMANLCVGEISCNLIKWNLVPIFHLPFSWRRRKSRTRTYTDTFASSIDMWHWNHIFDCHSGGRGGIKDYLAVIALDCTNNGVNSIFRFDLIESDMCVCVNTFSTLKLAGCSPDDSFAALVGTTINLIWFDLIKW